MHGDINDIYQRKYHVGSFIIYLRL